MTKLLTISNCKDCRFYAFKQMKQYRDCKPPKTLYRCEHLQRDLEHRLQNDFIPDTCPLPSVADQELWELMSARKPK